eukprot:TRINITY_DN31033_c0_g1_i1.p1 TRINITY_DN31033_c0_g1~~TRINITY_DN31033_c0_g1_i1.p1  ORF type:complete len:410 (-),score=55.98 TRINITY_DN31033_c0_g1_i1:1061-2290(-)
MTSLPVLTGLSEDHVRSFIDKVRLLQEELEFDAFPINNESQIINNIGKVLPENEEFEDLGQNEQLDNTTRVLKIDEKLQAIDIEKITLEISCGCNIPQNEIAVFVSSLPHCGDKEFIEDAVASHVLDDWLRVALNSSRWSSTTVVQRCPVSVIVSTLVSKMAGMFDWLKLSNQTHHLIQTVRLFVTGMQLWHAGELQVPGLGLVFHNDCSLLAATLQSLGVGCEDTITLLTNTATAALVQALHHEEERLLDIVYSADGFHDLSEPVRLRRVTHSMSQLASALKAVHRVWLGSIFEGLATKCLEQIATTIIKKVLVELQKIDCIVENEAADLITLINPVTQLFITWGLAPAHTRKLQSTLRVLQLPLSDIVSQYSSGSLPDLSAAELFTFINALFDDSPEKSSALAALTA